MKNAFAFCAFLAATVSAHMQMSNPYPIRSPLNPKGDEGKKDYSYTAPLEPSGANFPCKGYQNDAFQSVATYTAGNQYDMSLAGSATHGGGSCQLSLSYDTGKTFTVIESMEGGCPLTSNYTFTIPSDAPTGQALFAWTWYNKVGNREMYMNCAQVTIEGGSSKRSHARDMMVARDSGSTAFKSRPPIFIANVNGPGGCTTIESHEVQFPMPGPDVIGKISDPDVGFKCTGTADFLGSGSSSGASSNSSSPASSSSASTGSDAGSSSSASTGSAAGSSSSTSTGSAAGSSSSTSTGSAAGSSSGSSSGSAAGSSDSGSGSGSAPAAQSSAATNTSPSAVPADPAPVASSAPVQSAEPATTSPSSGAQVPNPPASSSSSAPRVVSSGAASSGQACSSPGAIVCGSDGSTWSMCNQGALTFMGSVAAGTTCSNGAITRK